MIKILPAGDRNTGSGRAENAKARCFFVQQENSCRTKKRWIALRGMENGCGHLLNRAHIIKKGNTDAADPACRKKLRAAERGEENHVEGN